MKPAESLKELMAIRDFNRAELDRFNASLGTALGRKKVTGQSVPGEPAILVFVPRKINPIWLPDDQKIPAELTIPRKLKCPVDVVEGQRARDMILVPRSESEATEGLRGWNAHIQPGSQIGFQFEGERYVGTLGAFARRRSGNQNLGFITNQHVGIAAGQKLYHPDHGTTELGTTQQTVELIRDEEWYVINGASVVDEPNTFVRADCAFATLSNEIATNLIEPVPKELASLGPVADISLENMSIVGRRVLKIGRTTGLTRGTIWGFGYEYEDGEGVTRYTDLLVVGDNGVAFSAPGDSGSLIVFEEPPHNPVGLLWGGLQQKLRTANAQEDWTYAVSLKRVLDALEVNLVTDPDDL